MEEVGSLARVGVFGNIRIGNKTMVVIRTASDRKSIPYEVLTHELLNYTEEHVAEPTESLFPREHAMVMPVDIEFDIDKSVEFQSVDILKNIADDYSTHVVPYVDGIRTTVAS